MIARPPYDESAASGAPYDFRELRPYADAATAPDATSYLAGWPGKYDYVLVLNADVAPDIDTFLPQEPIVFSHGWPLSADAFEDQMFFLGVSPPCHVAGVLWCVYGPPRR